MEVLLPPPSVQRGHLNMEGLLPTSLLNWMSMYFPKRLELSFFRVLALPKACGEVQETEREIRARGWYDTVQHDV